MVVEWMGVCVHPPPSPTFYFGEKLPTAEFWNDIGRNSLLGNRKKIAKYSMRTFTCRSTFLYAPEGHPGKCAYTCMLSYSIVVPHLSFNFLCLLLLYSIYLSGWALHGVLLSLAGGVWPELVWFVLWWTGRTGCLALPYRTVCPDSSCPAASWWHFQLLLYSKCTHNHSSWLQSRMAVRGQLPSAHHR